LTPLVLVQLTDCHVVSGPDGDEAAAALAEVVAAIRALPVAPAAVLVSGDLTHDGRPESYARVRELLAPLGGGLHVIPGNHDDRDALLDAFGPQDDAQAGPFRLLLVDTTIPGRGGGQVDVEALEARLDERETIVAMHHPPLRTGIKLIDDIGLRASDRPALEAMLARNPQVRRLVCGHVHRVTFETLGGCGVFTCPATHQQIEPGPERGSYAFVSRGRGFAIHTLLDGALVSQVQPV
jgi:3',5'-cyclic-AMP phosphodiesterase